MGNLPRITATRKTGAEPFTANGQPIGPTLVDFWGWRLSDLLDNLERGALAEFIVATALGIPTDGVRDAGAVWDLTSQDGVRIEVKSAAYLQSWYQKRLARITFSTRKTLAWDPDTGEFAAVAQRHADVYVFAHLAHTDKRTVDPLNLDQWRFYVLPRDVLDRRGQDSITLKALQELTAATPPDCHDAGFNGLRDTVRLAAGHQGLGKLG
jgi:hypothetical protein